MSITHVNTTSRDIETLRAQIAPKATDDELRYFAAVCKRLDLSPFADQIVLIGRWNKELQRKVHKHQITVAGRRTLAYRDPRLAGIEGPMWCGPRVNGELQWQEVWDDEGEPPYCARTFVHVKEWVVPANGTTKWSEFAQREKDGTLVPKWRDMPSHMLGKCSESLALRRAFPDILTPEILDGFDRPDDVDMVEVVEAVAVNDVDEATGELSPPDEDQPAAGVKDVLEAARYAAVHNQGGSNHRCERCGEDLGTDPIDPLGHGRYAHKTGCPT